MPIGYPVPERLGRIRMPKALQVRQTAFPCQEFGENRYGFAQVRAVWELREHYLEFVYILQSLFWYSCYNSDPTQTTLPAEPDGCARVEFEWRLRP